jgi:NTP pyrophosphatase (non-canonical NTP hydrolase)
MEEILRNNIKIVDHYGVEAQIPVWIEEMSELTKELCKWSRKGMSEELIEHIKEEIADVSICLDQLKYTIMYTEDDLMKEYKYKVDRQLERIKNGKDK